jgi:methylmalonyl-CoA epimerase
MPSHNNSAFGTSLIQGSESEMLEVGIHLDHIGIAVSQIPQMKKLLLLLGIPAGHVEDVPEQGVRTHFFPISGEGSHLELLESVDPQGTVAKFLEKKGPGIHHLSFRVAAGYLDTLCDKLKHEGYRLIYEKPKAGAHGMKINFIHPASAGGLLIEVMEPSR